MSARWYVVHTQPNGESRADEHLRRQGYITYLPRLLKRRRHARKTEMVSRPLFPRYMFVQLDVASQGWHAIRSTFGVAGLVGGENGPQPVQDGIVESLLAARGEDGYFRAAASRAFRPGAAIRVVEGIFASASGFFESMSDNERVSVLLELLGRRVRVVLDYESVVPA
jgi:transcriptional antiterminator RfaH